LRGDDSLDVLYNLVSSGSWLAEGAVD